MKTKKAKLLEMLGRHTGVVTARTAGYHRQIGAAELAGFIRRQNLPLPAEVWAAGFDYWRAEP